MLISSIFLGSHKLELYNSLFGKEVIKLDDQIVSSKHSILGADHLFRVNENGKKTAYRVKFRPGTPVAFDIYRENEPFILSPGKQFWRLGLIVLAVILIWEFLQGRIIPF